MYSKPTVYMYVSQKAVCAVCEQHFFPVCLPLALSQTVCNRRCEALATHSGKYLGWFPSECLGVPMECPPPNSLLLPLLIVAPSHL